MMNISPITNMKRIQKELGDNSLGIYPLLFPNINKQFYHESKKQLKGKSLHRKQKDKSHINLEGKLHDQSNNHNLILWNQYINTSKILTESILEYKERRQKLPSITSKLRNRKSIDLSVKSKKKEISKREEKVFYNCSSLHKVNPFNNYEDIKKEHYCFELMTLHKNCINQSVPTFNFLINMTYRKQIPEYMKHRLNWKMVLKKREGYNFRWKYFPKKVDFKVFQYHSNTPQEKLKIINIFEKYYELGNKKKFALNMLKYCNEMNLNPFDYIPFSFILTKRNNFEKNIQSLEELIAFLSSSQIQDSLKLKQDNIIITKDLYTDKFKHENPLSLPNVYISIPRAYLSKNNYWIVKPIDLFQGIGIKVITNINEMKSHADTLFTGMEKITAEQEEKEKDHPELKKKKRKKYKSSSILVQKYLDHPLLYNKRKFDIRCFVLVDHCLNVFVCREGHLKACSEQYSLDLDNHFAHITNYSLQKKCENFSKYEYGNEISYHQFRDCLRDNYNKDIDLFNNIMKQMKRLIEISMNCVGKKMSIYKGTLSFQIFGYDFIIDEHFRPWILEINDNPGLEISSPVIAKLIPRMVDDAFRLTIDQVFETVYDEKCIDKEANRYKSLFPLDGYSDSENVFEFVCNINKYPYDK